MDEVDRMLVNRLQDGIDVVERPFAPVAAELGFPRPRSAGGCSGWWTRGGCRGSADDRRRCPRRCLHAGGAARARARIERVAALVNAHPEVAHNYRREHPFNMWFVIATERPEEVAGVLEAIERETGYRAINLPKQREYYLRLKLDAGAAR